MNDSVCTIDVGHSATCGFWASCMALKCKCTGSQNRRTAALAVAGLIADKRDTTLLEMVQVTADSYRARFGDTPTEDLPA